MNEPIRARDADIIKALLQHAAGAWRSLHRQECSDTVAASATPEPRLKNALLEALCTSPLQQHSANTNLNTLFHLSPHSACAIALCRSHLAVAQEFILCSAADNAISSIRQALLALLNAIEIASISVPEEARSYTLSQADPLCRVLQSQLEVAVGVQRGTMPRQLALVLGMHRSGTSALTGLLVQAGLDGPRDPMPPSTANPKGYFESLTLFGLNEQLLQQLGSHWSMCWSLPNDGWELQEPARHWRTGLLSYLETTYPPHTRPILKDPRLCVLISGLRPWLESDLIQCVFFMPIRHPAEVAASLHAAEGFPKDQALLLWLAHVFQAEKQSRGHQRVIVDFEQLLSQPAAVLQRCEQTLVENSYDTTVDHSWNPSAADFIEPGLRRGHAELHANVATWVTDERVEPWFELALQAHQVLVNPNVEETQLTDEMDALHQQWTDLIL